MNGSLAHRPPRRRGTTITEALVACGIAATAISVAATIQVRGWRLLSDVRQDRLAIDELSNQLQRIRHTPDSDLQRTVEQLTPSEFVRQQLPEARMQGRISDGDQGQQVTVELTWDRPGRRERPLRMSIWRPEGDLP